MSKISNIITMLEYLSNGRKYSAKELANRLEVSERMIRTYKEELEKAGIYLDTIRGPYGGYVLKEKNRLPQILFSKEDSEVLEQILATVENQEIRNKIKKLENKISRFCQEASDCKLDLDCEIVIKYNLISKAIKEKRKIEITYFSKGKNKKRIIVPFQLFLYDSLWFVIVQYSMDKKDIRYLNLNRIEKMNLI